jgi:hypothetical protein
MSLELGSFAQQDPLTRARDPLAAATRTASASAAFSMNLLGVVANRQRDFDQRTVGGLGNCIMAASLDALEFRGWVAQR